MKSRKQLSETEFNEKIDRQNDRVCGLIINVFVSVVTSLIMTLLCLKTN